MTGGADMTNEEELADIMLRLQRLAWVEERSKQLEERAASTAAMRPPAKVLPFKTRTA